MGGNIKMIKKNTRLKFYLTLTLVSLLITTFLPITLASDIDRIDGFEKGVTWQQFKSLKKATLVNFDKDTLIDDYAYLASIPSSVFSDGNTLFTSPLLLFQPKNTYPDEDKYLNLNDYPGTQYLMEDWMGYCNGQLDKLITVNVNKKDLDSSWISRERTEIKSNDPYKLASDIALSEWSYSDNAVVAVIEESYNKPENTEITKSISGKISGEVENEQLTLKRPFGIASEYEYFTVEDEYKYIRADLWYASFVIRSKLLNLLPGFGGADGVTLPSVDPDLQLFCKYENDWLQTSAASEMAITNGPHEECFTYVYKPGEWRVGVTNMPTKGFEDNIHYGPLGKGKITRYGTFKDAMKNLISGVKELYVDIEKYPGTEIEIPETPPVGCRDAKFKLTWDNKNIKLGLTIIGPSGEEIDSALKEETDFQEINFHQLGECLEGEHYKVVVYALNDITTPLNFKVDYSWQQNITREEADMIASACEGAILGSLINSPLLYVKPDETPKTTIETLNKLGVKNIYLVDLGKCLKEDAKKQLSTNSKIVKDYTEYADIYNEIMTKTGKNDVIFSTIDPWTYWYYNETPAGAGPAGEFKGAYLFGPAAYAAAHHGSPLILIDNHPELSGAATWHADFWKKHSNGYTLPSVGCMFLTGSKVYKFLREYGFDKPGAIETILTVADKYDLGPTWTRCFAGLANPGAIIGTPVDASNQITRCIFYPGLIFQNPALQGKVTLINGSISERVQSTLLHPFRTILARLGKSTPGLSNLKILRESGPEEYTYPVLHTYGCYEYRFNERGSKYWGVPYQTRNGYTPGLDISSNEIDQGVREKYEGLAGCFLPDLSVSDIAPFYASKAGYSNAFSMDYDITIDNLNKGVITWYMVLHGNSADGGIVAWWQPMSKTLQSVGIPPKMAQLLGNLLGIPTGSNPYEPNPWRGYDMLWGSTEEPDSASLNAEIGMFLGFLGLANKDGPLNGGILKTGLDILPTNIPLFKFLGNRENYFDGLVGPYGLTAHLAKFQYSHPAKEIDEKLENLHSMDFHAGSCLIACTYLQIALMRHGSVSQELDPWPTSYWAGYSFEKTPREFALGKTIGETYSEGITEIGIKYVFEENEERTWWWDNAENICLFTDPNLRIWVPSTKWDPEAKNHWELDDVQPLRYDVNLDVNGHMPFGATTYPNAREPTSLWQQYIWLIALILIVILAIVAIALGRKKKK